MTDFWGNLLERDEKVLWQDRPEPCVRLEWNAPSEAVMGLFAAGFPIFWMSAASQTGSAIWRVGLIPLGIGLYQLVGSHLWLAFKRNGAAYRLTSRRAIIATTRFGKRVSEATQPCPLPNWRLKKAKRLRTSVFPKAAIGCFSPPTGRNRCAEQLSPPLKRRATSSVSCAKYSRQPGVKPHDN